MDMTPGDAVLLVSQLAMGFALAAGNPVLSIFDDVLAVGGIIMAVLAPIIAALIVLVVAIGAARLIAKRRRAAASPVSTAPR